MKQDDFTNREIEAMFRDIKIILERVEAQVNKTNGRVTLLEMWKETFMARVATLVAVVSVLWIGFKELILNK